MHKDKEKDKSAALGGYNNGRLLASEPTASEATAAWTDRAGEYKNSKTAFPAKQDTIHAKAWVDNGSKL